MENIVAVVRGDDKRAAFHELLDLSRFDAVLLQACQEAKKTPDTFAIAIKPNMMVFLNLRDHEAVVTDKDLVEMLVDHLCDMGFRHITVCEAQNDVGRMLQHHTVAFVAAQIGYDPRDRYRIADLTHESETYRYRYIDAKGKTRTWKDKVGRSWRDADFRLSFAKCKTHEHDWLTLGVKNIYGCLPRPDKVQRYHIRQEMSDLAARALANFPVHFTFVDAWIASDGFQGYKLPRPKHLRMLFGGNNTVAVDMEIFTRAGVDPYKSSILRRSVEQLYAGEYPKYLVRGDQHTTFQQRGPWENISDTTVKAIDILEEIYIAWGILNLEPVAVQIDYAMFPPKNLLTRIAVWCMKKLYSVFKLSYWLKRCLT